MKLYVVKCVAGKRYAGSQTEVRSHRADLVEKFKVKKSEVTVEEVEVKTSKPELLSLINDLCKEAEA